MKPGAGILPDLDEPGVHDRPHLSLPCTREVFAATQAWTRRVFPALPEPAPYDAAILA